MRVSIIIPCFQAEKTILQAVYSVLEQHHHGATIELVIAADDSGDYSVVRGLYPDAVLVPPLAGRHGTGPGATRNRGINASSGDVLAFLDADDAWSPTYLSTLLPLVKRYGAAFAPTSVYAVDDPGKSPPLITLGQGLSYLTPADFGFWPGSFHPCVMRHLTDGFDHGAGQDVFHALEILGYVGGRAPMASSAHYRLNLRGGSVTAEPSFAQYIGTRYRQRIKAYQTGATRLNGMARIHAIQALYRRLAWNKSWLAEGHHPNGFYGYMAVTKAAM